MLSTSARNAAAAEFNEAHFICENARREARVAIDAAARHSDDYESLLLSIGTRRDERIALLERAQRCATPPRAALITPGTFALGTALRVAAAARDAAARAADDVADQSPHAQMVYRFAALMECPRAEAR